jgi:hypothetical protein
MKLSDKAKESLQVVIQKFQAGDLSPLVDVVMLARRPDDTMPAARWSLGNRVLAYVQSGGQLDCRGFRQWEQVGRKVKKGGRGVFILAPSTIKIEQDGEADVRVVGFHTLAVFALSETEGDDLARVDYAPAQLPPLADVAQRLGVTLDYAAMPEEGHAAMYVPKHDAIVMGTHSRQVFWHELAHAAHARIAAPTHRGKVADKEVVAEFTACVLSALYGEDYSGNAWRYISEYADDPLTAIYKALADVEKVLDLLLGEDGA